MHGKLTSTKFKCSMDVSNIECEHADVKQFSLSLFLSYRSAFLIRRIVPTTYFRTNFYDPRGPKFFVTFAPNSTHADPVSSIISSGVCYIHTLIGNVRGDKIPSLSNHVWLPSFCGYRKDPRQGTARKKITFLTYAYWRHQSSHGSRAAI